MEKYSKPTWTEFYLSQNELLCQSEQSQDLDGLIYNMPIDDLSGDL